MSSKKNRSDKESHLCSLEKHGTDPEQLKKIAGIPAYECRKCNRRAEEMNRLCKPEKL